MARQHVTFNIFGKSHAAINAAKKAIEQLCDKESTEIILNSEHDQASIKKLTSREVNIYLMRLCYYIVYGGFQCLRGEIYTTDKYHLQCMVYNINNIQI